MVVCFGSVVWLGKLIFLEVAPWRRVYESLIDDEVPQTSGITQAVNRRGYKNISGSSRERKIPIVRRVVGRLP
jgi:hypothetical protein